MHTIKDNAHLIPGNKSCLFEVASKHRSGILHFALNPNLGFLFFATRLFLQSCTTVIEDCSSWKDPHNYCSSRLRTLLELVVYHCNVVSGGGGERAFNQIIIFNYAV